ncbi:MAG TPA: sigma-54-dependent Fis family transcriptional regulator [Desulfitobacterium dehalogenans]|uniref:Stage 0 sporulation protein A homolog n=1 Tax=Desulfitobacterium dehalogenans TaxID=36854 RepID=A0A7C7D7E2_9FIRM|nr:sigma-54-dependent Fis family transcriptional regulator [Desulfitobacterium dehalogenans]
MGEDRHIVVIDDEPDMLETCARVIHRMGYKCTTYEDSCEALEEIHKLQPDLIITDIKMPKCDGFEVLEKAKVCVPKARVIVITGYASVDSAVQAMKEGAYDYLSKPFPIEQLQLTINKALQHIALTEENQLLRAQLQEGLNTDNIIGARGGLQDVFATIGKISNSDASILILGESGTGKEVIARAIHKNSRRSTGPFIPVDCASLPENLLESELFGYERGAFTGANNTKQGLLEMAHGGTLFLDELGELTLAMQAKLLRTLEERAIRRVGGNRLINIDIRVLAATNRDLEKAVRTKEFREDLYYRINVITLKLPILHERQQDIPLLVNHFCKKYSQDMDKKVGGFTPEAMKVMKSYSWPGNIRELRNVVERAISLSESEMVGITDLPEKVIAEQKKILPEQENLGGLSFHEAKDLWLKKFEVKYMNELLDNHNGNITQAAKSAGIDRKTIHRLMNKYDLQR